MSSLNDRAVAAHDWNSRLEQENRDLRIALRRVLMSYGLMNGKTADRLIALELAVADGNEKKIESAIARFEEAEADDPVESHKTYTVGEAVAEICTS